MKIQRCNYIKKSEDGTIYRKENYLAIFWKWNSCKHIKIPFTTKDGLL